MFTRSRGERGGEDGEHAGEDRDAGRREGNESDRDDGADSRAAARGVAFHPPGQRHDRDGGGRDDGQDDGAGKVGERPLVATDAEDRAGEAATALPGSGRQTSVTIAPIGANTADVSAARSAGASELTLSTGSGTRCRRSPTRPGTTLASAMLCSSTAPSMQPLA